MAFAERSRWHEPHDPLSASRDADAAAGGFEIVRTYVDAGKSGLRIYGRDALKQLIADVEGVHHGNVAVLQLRQLLR